MASRNTSTKRQRIRKEGSDAEDDPGDAHPGPARRHVGRACSTCRQSHGKCDGKEPVCGSCKVHNRECRYSKAIDRRRRLGAAEIEAVNERIKELELENRQLRDYCRQNNLDVDQAVPQPGPVTLTITHPDTPRELHLSTGGNHHLEGASPATSSAPSSPWSIGPPSPAPWSQGLPSDAQQYLGVPDTFHGRSGGFSSDDESQSLPFDKAGHMGIPLLGMYGNGTVHMRRASTASSSSSPYATSSSSLAPSPFLGANLSTASFNVTQDNNVLAANLATMTLNIQCNNAIESQNATAAPVYPNGGANILSDEDFPLQGYYPMEFSGAIDIDGSTLLTGTSMGPWPTQPYGDSHMREE